MNGSVLMMDKNKSAYKLTNLPPILWMNLDADDHRRQHMETQFSYWQIENHTRISGVDGRDGDVTDLLKGKIPDNMSMNEIGCCLSHLKCIRYFIEETDYPEILILEDDILFDTAKYWQFSWSDMYAKLPYDYDTVQLTTINPATIYINLHPRFINDFSAAAYIITRHHAEKIYKNHIKPNNKYKLDNGVNPRAVSEDLILNTGKSYCFPIFVYRLDLGSAIHPEHIDIFHRDSYNGIINFWERDSYNLEGGLDQLMNWHPYEFGLPPGFDANGPIPRAEQPPS